jgi:adenylyltransferase/sulfurtransferase
VTISGDERFARFERIQWWDQSRLSRARILVVGAGALGNEVIKNLSLLGAGNLVIVDRDHVERSNLSRSVLFRSADEGQPKASVAARAAAEIYPGLRVRAVTANVLAEVGLGYFRWADVVVGALDNREARVFVNSSCARLGRPWIDGGIDVFQGIVRGFGPPAAACYECTMGRVDWEALNQRRSCSLLARRAHVHGGTPTTPITASVIGALQAQEVVKLLHGLSALCGGGFVLDGLTFEAYPVNYPINPECPWHEDLPHPVAAENGLSSASTLRDAWDAAEGRWGRVAALELSREWIAGLTCPACRRQRRLLMPLDCLTEADAVCENCGTECAPALWHTIEGTSDVLDLSLRDLHFPAWDILWARQGDRFLGLEVAGDRPADLPARSVAGE